MVFYWQKSAKVADVGYVRLLLNIVTGFPMANNLYGFLTKDPKFRAYIRKLEF